MSPSPIPSPRLPVVIVGGLHSAARTEAVEGLLRAVPGSVALHHDLATAAQGTVRRTLRDASGEQASGEAPLVNGCACCALREDLVPELVRLADAGLTRLAVVELWDSVEPKAMAEVIAAHAGDRLALGNVVTAVDLALLLPCLGNGDDLADAGLATAATDRRTVADTFARQLEYAPVLAVVEGDGTDDVDRALLAQLHPTALRVPAGASEPATLDLAAPEPAVPEPAALDPAALDPAALDPAALDPAALDPAALDPATPDPAAPDLAALAVVGFDVAAAAARQHPACALLPQEADECGVGTLVWRRRRPFHPERLYAALEDLACAAARSRGRFWLADRPDTLLAWDAAGGALCVEGAGPWLASLPGAAWDLVPPVRRAAASLDWHPVHGDRCQHLVFTSPALDRDGLARLLDSCLLTDDEYAAGPEGWKALPRAFDGLLDPVA